jgi:antirestriction protein ArdC
MSKEATALAVKKIEEGLKTLFNDEAWKQYLRMQGKLHQYSFGNVVLILAQKPDAIYVAGYKTWQRFGRYVKKGEKGIIILAPIIAKPQQQDKPENKEEADNTARRLVGFTTAHVFDISQTDGKPFPQPEISRLAGNKPELYQQLLRAVPFPVQEAEDLCGANGYIVNGNRIYILSSLTDTHKAKTLVHEWAHGLMHQTQYIKKEQAELEAESVAFSVCSALGLDTSSYSFGYLATWAKEDAIEMLKDSAARIQKTADAILSAVEAVTEVSEAVC